MDTPASATGSAVRPHSKWLDVPWLVFLLGLAVLPPFLDWHKQLILLVIGVVQLAEARLVAYWPRRGPILTVVLNILLATLLIDHTGELIPSINSSYYPIYFVPVITAALYFGPAATLLWTMVTSAAYSSYLY